jgi:hypothetical protein
MIGSICSFVFGLAFGNLLANCLMGNDISKVSLLVAIAALFIMIQLARLER